MQGLRQQGTRGVKGPLLLGQDLASMVQTGYKPPQGAPENSFAQQCFSMFSGLVDDLASSWLPLLLGVGPHICIPLPQRGWRQAQKD